MTIIHVTGDASGLHLPIALDLAVLVLIFGGVVFAIIAYDLYRQIAI